MGRVASKVEDLEDMEVVLQKVQSIEDVAIPSLWDPMILGYNQVNVRKEANGLPQDSDKPNQVLF